MGLSKFDKSYFIGGAESNYINYPKRKYKQLAKDISKTIKDIKYDNILDFGCATGNLVREFVKMRYSIYGTDISKWAISYGIRKFNLQNNIWLYNNTLLIFSSLILMLDVIEHMTLKKIDNFLIKFKKYKGLKILVRIPVSAIEGQDFVLNCSKKDKTHIQVHSKTWWRKLFKKYGFEITKVIDEKAIYDSDGVIAWVLTKE